MLALTDIRRGVEPDLGAEWAVVQTAFGVFALFWAAALATAAGVLRGPRSRDSTTRPACSAVPCRDAGRPAAVLFGRVG